MHPKLTISDICNVTQGKLLREGRQTRVSGVSIDSRTVKKGELFVAVKGERFDGHAFIAKAIRKGAAGVVISKRLNIKHNVNLIKVKDTTHALGQIATFHRDKFDIPVIAITGSAGKTTTKELVAAVLGSKYKVLKNQGSFNNQFGVPLTLFQLNSSHQAAVLEIGTNQPGDIKELTQIVQPTIAILTNIGEAHLEKLKTPAGVFKEKMDLVKYMPKKGIVIFNADDKYLSRIQSKKIPQKKIGYAIKTRIKRQAKKIRVNGGTCTFSLLAKRFKINYLSEHSIYNALCAILAGEQLKVSYNSINRHINKKVSIKGRLIRRKFGSLTVIDDTYNANPLSFRVAVKSLHDLRVKGKKILVCADMLELGKQSKDLHAQMGRWIASTDIQYVLGIGHHTRSLIAKVKQTSKVIKTKHFANINKLNVYLKAVTDPKDAILVKGSRAMQMEQTVSFLNKRYG